MNKLTDYYLTQPPEIIAKALACTMLDICRLRVLDSLCESEISSLFDRIDKTTRQVHKFAKNGPKGDLKIHVTNSDNGS